MGLRTKIAAIFVPLLVIAVLAVSATEANHAVGVMVESLGDSGNLLVNETFEQIRTALEHSKGDPIAVLRQDQGLAALLSSSRAFGKGVVYARVVTPNGDLIAGTSADAVRGAPPRPFAELEEAASRWSPLARIRPLWGEHVYEISSPVEIDQRPFALIKVGLSTALIATEVHRAVANVLFIAIAVMVISLLGALLAGALLLAPVAAITAEVERLAAGRDSSSLLVRGRDELSSLARKFNELSHRVRSDRVQWEDETRPFHQYFSLDRRCRAAARPRRHRAFLQRRCAGASWTSRRRPRAGQSALAALIGESHPLVRVLRTARAAATELRDVAIEEGRGRDKARLLVSIFPLGGDSTRAGQLVIVRDLDSVQQLETVVDNSERLARLGGVFSGVAHQIRNPLNAITLELELLSQDARESRPVEGRVHAVREEMSRIDQVIEALMRFMRPGQLKIELVAANDLVREVAKGVNEPLIKVECDLDPAAAFVKADRALLMEALRNIVQNAIDAMTEGGILTLTTRLVDGFVEFSISDTGEGIAPEHLDNIFQLYFTTKKNGNGVGLPLAVRAVDLHGGTVNIDSRLNEGTSVRIRLPIEDRALRAPADVNAD